MAGRGSDSRPLAWSPVAEPDPPLQLDHGEAEVPIQRRRSFPRAVAAWGRGDTDVQTDPVVILRDDYAPDVSSNTSRAARRASSGSYGSPASASSARRRSSGLDDPDDSIGSGA
jgi:hypothetical protein